MKPEIRVESLFRAARSPYSTDVVASARVEARLFASESAPRIGRFILSERVGRGGMGTVYAAFDPQLGRRVAVKILHPEISGVRLLREAQAMARLRHPNLLTIYEVGEYQNQAYIAMEFIDGHSLGELQRIGQIEWRRWLAHYLVAGRGLAAAHQGRLVHRDFKPESGLASQVVENTSVPRLHGLYVPSMYQADGPRQDRAARDRRGETARSRTCITGIGAQGKESTNP